VQDNGGTANGGSDTLTQALTISVTPVNDPPVRTAGSLNNLTMLEDSGLTSLGLGTVAYSPGPADEAGQTLTYTVTAVPASTLGNVVLADGTTLVSSGTIYSLTQLQGMQFQTVLNANGGPATFSFQVQDSGGTANGGSDTLIQALTISVTPVNDPPVRTAGTLNNLTVLEDSGLTSLGLGALAYSPGGGTDEAGQTLTYTVTAVPAPTLGNVVLADGVTVVTIGTSYSLTQLQGMQFQTVLHANGGPASFSFQVQDNGGTANGGADAITEALTITVTPAMTGTLSGMVFLDGDVDGSFDTGEEGRAGVTVYLDIDGNGSLGTNEPRTISDVSGHFSFGNLAAGGYTVLDVVPAGFRQTTSNPSTINLAGASVGDIRFGLTPTLAGITTSLFLINGTTTYNDLRDNTNARDMVEVTFTIADGVTDFPVHLVSYAAPDSSFIASRAYLQQVYEVDGGSFSTGTYTITVNNPNSYFQVDFVLGRVIQTVGGPPGNYDPNNFYSAQGRLISADNGDPCGRAPLSSPGEISGNVYDDTNGNGTKDAGESGLGPVRVFLDANNNGCLDSNEYSTFTRLDGSYDFNNLSPGTYRVRLVVPDGRTQTSANPASVSVSAGSSVLGGNFGARLVSGNTIGLRTTESIGWWNGPTGQNLIQAFGGSASSTALGKWLATSFPKLYGSSSGSCNDMTGKTNTQVASYYKGLYNLGGSRLEAKVMATALSVYATTSSLGGTAGMFYGFTVTTSGLGASTYNVGSNGAAFGVSDNSNVSVLTMLQYTNSQATGNANLYGGNSTKRTKAGNIYDCVLKAGDAD